MRDKKGDSAPQESREVLHNGEIRLKESPVEVSVCKRAYIFGSTMQRPTAP